eukprot:9404654-Alexandrium_andersonii.AAC.1
MEAPFEDFGLLCVAREGSLLPPIKEGVRIPAGFPPPRADMVVTPFCKPPNGRPFPSSESGIACWLPCGVENKLPQLEDAAGTRSEGDVQGVAV